MYTREQAEHFCPCALKADRITPSEALSRSAVRMTSAGFLDVADAFETVLAGLVPHQRGELPAARADPVRHFFHERHALAPRTRAPGRERRLRRRDRVAYLLGRFQSGSREQVRDAIA